MNIEEFRKHCITKKGVTEEFPFDGHTLVFKVMGKMFALTGLERIPTQVNLKCDPDKSIILREEYEGVIIPGYHMSKKHWNTLFIEQLPKDFVKTQIDYSYALVRDGLAKKVKTELEDL